MPTVSVAIPTRNRPDALEATLESLREQKRVPDQIIVVDDSDGGHRERVRTVVARFPDVRLIEKTTPGLTASRNLAAETATGELLVFLDDDVVLEPGFLESVELAFGEPSVMGVGGVIENSPLQRRPRLARLTGLGGEPTGRLLPTGWITPLPRVTSTVEYLSGCNMAYRTDVVRRQRFDETSFLGYGFGEDLEFSNRVHRQEGRLVVVGDARLEHHSRTTTNLREFGRAEMVVRPRIAQPSFSRVRFLIAALALTLSHLSEPKRAAGNLQGAVSVLLSRPG